MPPTGMAKASSIAPVRPSSSSVQFVLPSVPIFFSEITQKVSDLGCSKFHQRCISIWPWWSSTSSDLDLFFKVTGQFQRFVHFCWSSRLLEKFSTQAAQIFTKDAPL